MIPHATLWEHCLETAALSDIGLRRGNNQDSMAVVIAGSQEKFQQRGHLFMVADGMGAHAAGELASKLAADGVPLTYHKLTDKPPPEALLASVQDANSQIHSRGIASDDFRGMGTTASVLVLLPEQAFLAHVGDSRVYRLRNNRLEQLTFDHSLVWELRAAGHVASEDSPNYIPKNIITRSLGPNAEVQVDLEGPFPIQTGDVYLLCSDGLSGQVSDDEIGKILAILSPQEAVRILVDLANLRGGPDNITVVVARVIGPLAAQGEAPASAPAAYPSVHAPVHPAIWAVSGVLLFAAALLSSLGYGLPAVISLVAAAAVAGFGLLQRYAGANVPAFDRGPLGKGPYTATESSPDASFVRRLAQVVQQLRDAAAGADWAIDWERFRAHEDRAKAGAQAENYAEAAREYCRALTFMMAELRSQQDRRKSDDDSSENVLETP